LCSTGASAAPVLHNKYPNACAHARNCTNFFR
jgi:hypothetical protein